MIPNLKNTVFIVLAASLTASYAFGQKAKDQGYKFTDIKEIQHTSVKDQARSGTCWSFAGISFFESEMLRMGKPETDLSEMYLVNRCYRDKGVKYVRMQGKINFSAGGELYDDLYVLKNYGLVPEEVYTGLAYGEEKHVHGEMDEVLHNMVEAVVKNKNRKITPVWENGYNATLDAYLGALPEEFKYKEKSYSPKSFASDYCGLNADNYIQITSFSHHPFYQQFSLEVPDNWLWSDFYNIPIDELQAIVDHSLQTGYSVLWAADVSEKGFSSSMKGIAVVPDKELANMDNAEIAKWDTLSEKDKQAEIYTFDRPVKEKVVTQALRQTAFDNSETTDDHGMHIIGLAKDQNGSLYYKVKNSWGSYNTHKGYFYASQPYLRYKTMAILVNKAAIPDAIRKKMGL